MTTAREFLKYAGMEDTEKNLYTLTSYLESSVDFAQFPDAAVEYQDVPLDEDPCEPAGFQEYADFYRYYS